MAKTQAELDELFKCPNCTARRLREVIDREGSIHHKCTSCGYFMIWKPREPWTEEKRRAELARTPHYSTN